MPPGSPARRRLFALVDCSAFYVSCERVFDPALEERPVAVLSNNDGCVVARSDEVRAAGVPMGEPFFRCRKTLEEIGAAVFSSNYALYADMSRRVMGCLHTFTPEVEPYSIDEAFLHLRTAGDTVAADRERLEALAHRIRARVLQWTGIPVRVSIAETKTLAKAASEFAKERLRDGEEPCVVFWEHPERDAFLRRLEVRDVWGIGRQWSRKLERFGYPSAYDLMHAEDRWIRKLTNVCGLRTAYELRGVSCIPLEEAPLPRQSLIRSRSFREPVTDLALLEQAVATHAARAAEKLRREGLAAARVGAFITTKGFGPGPHRTGWIEVQLPQATNRTPDLIAAAKGCLARAYVAATPAGFRFRYRKAGVVVSEVHPAAATQAHLFEQPDEGWTAGQARLMEAVDLLNRRFGPRAVVFAAMGAPKPLEAVAAGTGGPAWGMRRERMSPRYTTRWNELVEARA